MKGSEVLIQPKELSRWQKRSIEIMQEEIDRAEYLYELTNHSKKKACHLRDLKYAQQILADMYQEYQDYDWEDLD